MTFYEAAVEILRRSGRPLHFKKITEHAIEHNLLSHVGKTPEITMSARLNQEVKREGEAAIERTRPGVYKLREDIAAKLNEEAKLREKEEASTAAAALVTIEEEKGEVELKVDAFTQEDDTTRDDEKEKFDSHANALNNSNDSNDTRNQSKRRTRRDHGHRRRHESDDTTKNGRSEERDDACEEPSEERAPRRRRNERSERGGRNSRSERGERGGRSNRSERGERNSRSERGERSSKHDGRERKGRHERRSDSRHTSSSTRGPQAPKPTSIPTNLDPIAQAAYTVLGDLGRPMDIEALSTEIYDQKLVRFHTHDAAMTVRAAMANDNQRRRQRGARQLFLDLRSGEWGLSDWGMSQNTLKKEDKILHLAQECREHTASFISESLEEIQAEALEHIVFTLLDGLGYGNIKVSKRSSEGHVFFTADWCIGLTGKRVCIQLCTDINATLRKDDIAQLRGTLHHYSASEGIIIHLGKVFRESVEESHQDRVACISIIDREHFVRLLMDKRIGVRLVQVPLFVVDTAYFDQLK